MAILGLSPYTWVMIAFLMLLVLVLILGDIGGIDFDHDISPGVDLGLSPHRLPVVPKIVPCPPHAVPPQETSAPLAAHSAKSTTRRLSGSLSVPQLHQPLRTA